MGWGNFIGFLVLSLLSQICINGAVFILAWWSEDAFGQAWDTWSYLGV
jgi:hypothetical protein